MYLPELALLISSLLWAVNFFVLKSAIGAMPVIWVIFYRFLISSIALAPFVFHRKWSLKIIVYGSICGTIFLLTIIPLLHSLNHTSISNSGFIFSVYILLVPIITYFMFGTKLSLIQVASVLLAFIGMVLISGYSTTTLGDSLALLGAVFASFHVIAIDRSMAQQFDEIVLTFIQSCIACILSGLFLLMQFDKLILIPSDQILNFLFLGIIATAFVTCLQCYGQKYVSAWKTCVIFATEPIFTAILAWYLLSENIGVSGWIGGLLIVAAICLSHLKFEQSR